MMQLRRLSVLTANPYHPVALTRLRKSAHPVCPAHLQTPAPDALQKSAAARASRIGGLGYRWLACDMENRGVSPCVPVLARRPPTWRQYGQPGHNWTRLWGLAEPGKMDG